MEDPEFQAVLTQKEQEKKAAEQEEKNRQQAEKDLKEKVKK